MSVPTAIVVWLNVGANAVGRLLDPIERLPGWASATLVAIVTGVAMLVAFKHTSNQRAIKRIRRDIRANLLAVKLFKDNLGLGFRSQGRVLVGAIRLLFLAAVPILVMTVPMVLLLAQLGLWYQAAPLPVGAETVIVVKLTGDADTPMPAVQLVANDAVEDRSGPVRVVSRREICWTIRTLRPGYHTLQFHIDDQTVEKELAVGGGIMRVSPTRPESEWSEVLLNPHEQPFDRASPVRAIEVEYPTRSSWTSGTDNWVIYWFVVSLLAGFCLRGPLKVNL